MSEYAKRDLMALDKAGDHYSRHVSAMTGEDLHAKSDIAAELAWRDMRIADLEAALTTAREQKEALRDRVIDLEALKRLPDGVTADGAGEYEAECRGCGQMKPIICDISEVPEEGYEHWCGGSPSCCP